MAMETHEPMNEYTLLQCEIQVEHRKIRFRTYQLTCVSWIKIMPCHAMPCQARNELACIEGGDIK
jgi:hypothetical protein